MLNFTGILARSPSARVFSERLCSFSELSPRSPLAGPYVRSRSSCRPRPEFPQASGHSCYDGTMWVRGAAIRPVPRYAVIAATTLESIERELAEDSDSARGQLDAAFSRFESTQPQLADALSRVLAKPLDE